MPESPRHSGGGNPLRFALEYGTYAKRWAGDRRNIFRATAAATQPRESPNFSLQRINNMKSPKTMNNLKTAVRFSFAVGVLLLASNRSITAHEGFTISAEPTKVTIEYNGKLVTNYIFQDKVANKPYFWPVIGPTGKKMTRSFPMETVEGEHHDHPHHRSIWFGHQGVGGTDTWLEAASKNHDGEKQKAFLATLGSTQHTAFTEISAHHEHAVIRSRNDYLDSAGKQLMADERSVIFRMTDGNLVIDFDITLIGKYVDI